jgi:[ribosomal protein S5]-alanine N-acetyltransferase
LIFIFVFSENITLKYIWLKLFYRGGIILDFAKVLKEFPVLKTDKILLRKLRLEDAPALKRYYSNENVYRYLDWNGPETLERSFEIINLWNKGYDEGWIIRFAIADKVTDEIIGTIFLNEFEGKRAEIGYELSENYWRRGIMSEAIREVLSFGFNQLGLVRIQALVCAENVASTEILKKFEFKEEGCLRLFECHSVTGECKDMWVYGLLNTEFQK